MDDQKNLVLAIALSLAVLILFNMMVAPPPPPEALEPADETLPLLPEAAALLPREAALTKAPRLPFANERLTGTINLQGAVFDDLTLTQYQQERAEDSPPITLLSPAGSIGAYYASFGWLSNAEVPLPDETALWSASHDKLTPEQPVTLSWENGAGLLFEQRLTIDKDYLLTVTHSIRNTSSESVALFPYGRLIRQTPTEHHTRVGFEGPLGVFEEKLEEVSYEDVAEQRQIKQTSTGGWIAFGDHYWLTALLPEQQQPLNYRMVALNRGGVPLTQIDFLGETVTLAPGATVTQTERFYAGAKDVSVLDRYAETYQLPLLDRAIDFGTFYFLTKPIFYALHAINHYIGNFGVAIIILTLCVRIILSPLAHKSFKSFNRMKDLAPQIKEIRERAGDDRMAMNKEIMHLYQKEKINPLAGCLPILLQIPVFFALYKTLTISIEMRHAPFFGWIEDLAAPDPTSVFNLFGLLPYDVPAILVIGVWPCLVGITMWISQHLQPTPPDKAQQVMLQIMPPVFTVITAQFPAGLAVYWTFNNLFSILQQKAIRWLADDNRPAAAARGS